MATLYTTLINQIRDKLPDYARSLIVDHMQKTVNDLTVEFQLNRSTEAIPLAEGVARYALDSDIIKIWVAELQYPSGQPIKLDQKSNREYDQSWYNVRLYDRGIPREIYWEPSSTGAKQVGLYPVPNITTLLLSQATNTTPIVIRTTTVHEQDEDGLPIYVEGVATNLAANGAFYGLVVDADDISLYYDSDLTEPVAGTGIGTGGMVAVAGKPFLRLQVSRKFTVLDDGAANIPDSLNDAVSAILIGTYKRWYEIQGTPAERQKWARSYLSAKTEARKLSSGIMADVIPESHPWVRRRRVRK